MSSDRWQKIEEIFLLALQQEPQQRAALLNEVCAGDEAIRQQLEALLASHEQAKTFLQTPAFENAVQFTADSPIEPRIVASDFQDNAGHLSELAK